MTVKFFCPYWGCEHLTYQQFLHKIKEAGYDGTEIILPYDQKSKQQIQEEANQLGLEIIGLWGGPIAGDFNTHLETYEAHLRNACSVIPKFVNVQTGKDHYTFDQNKRFIDLASQIGEEFGVKIVHETHRGMFSFAAHVTKDYLNKIPDLRLTADFSHWCCVAESMLEDQTESIDLAISRTDHIHARVGFEEGPQIPDPRTPEWQETLNIHLSWWDQIIETASKKGLKEFTISPEFGPFPYMTQMPFTAQPITSQWDVNLYMKDLLNERYN